MHPPRVAWDGAQALISTCELPADFRWVSERVGELLGPQYEDALYRSMLHLRAPDREDVREVELGVWRVRIQDALQARPDLMAPLAALVTETKHRLAA
jgi:hypothetical protein